MIQPYMSREKAIEILLDYLKGKKLAEHADFDNAIKFAVRDMQHIERGKVSGPDPRY